MLIGCHVSFKSPNYYLDSVKEALSYDCNTFMIYTGPPQNNIRADILLLKINEAKLLLEKNNIKTSSLVVHAPYIINLANPDLQKQEFSKSVLVNEIRRTYQLGIKNLVLHPGSAVSGDREKAIIDISSNIKDVLNDTSDLDVNICLETMAGKGNEVGKSFEEIATLIKNINSNRVKVCLDTCHIFDAGYDIKNNYEKVLNDFDKIVGLNNIAVIHLNDTKNSLGQRKDRHENIGKGYIGFETLYKICCDDRFKKVPKILETPYLNNKPPYKEEIKMLKNGLFNSDF